MEPICACVSGTGVYHFVFTLPVLVLNAVLERSPAESIMCQTFRAQ